MSNPEAGKGVVPPWNPPVRQAVADVFLIYGMLSRSMIGVNGSVAYTTEHPEAEIYVHAATEYQEKPINNLIIMYRRPLYLPELRAPFILRNL